MKHKSRVRDGELRQRAEARIRSTRRRKPPPTSPEKTAELVYELRVYQIELELQNDELQLSHAALEESNRSLALSEERYRIIYETAPVAHLMLDADGFVRSANPAAELLLRSSARHLVGRRFSDFVAPEHQDLWHRRRRALARGATREPLSLDLHVAEGAVAHVELAASPIPDAHPPSGLSIAILDVTERKQAERAMRESERRVRLLTEAVPLLVAFIDRDERYRFVNPAYESWFGVPLSEIRGHTVREVLGEGAYAVIAPYVADALAGSAVSFEAEVPYRHSGSRFVSVTYSPDVREDGSVQGFYSTVLDLTALNSAKRALRAAAVEASLTEQRERRRLAADLHDDVAQLLSLASMSLRELADAADGPERGRLLETVTGLVANARERVSSLSFQLSPPVLHDVGLVAAADWLAEDLQRSYGLDVVVSAEAELDQLNDASRVTLFRALRELLINVARHAGTSEARVHVGRRGAMVEISVEDHGFGFDPDAATGGFGLRSLSDRLEHLGGGVAIDSAPGRGASIRAWAPIEGDERPGAVAGGVR